MKIGAQLKQQQGPKIEKAQHCSNIHDCHKICHKNRLTQANRSTLECEREIKSGNGYIRKLNYLPLTTLELKNHIKKKNRSLNFAVETGKISVRE